MDDPFFESETFRTMLLFHLRHSCLSVFQLQACWNQVGHERSVNIRPLLRTLRTGCRSRRCNAECKRLH
eukprot:6590321-Lingulodinium_polyedra.AAC.1